MQIRNHDTYVVKDEIRPHCEELGHGVGYSRHPSNFLEQGKRQITQDQIKTDLSERIGKKEEDLREHLHGLVSRKS